MTIKAIQTVYRGYHFRSRLEARWAVFFDALGLRWEYEPEGFTLSDGGYLPDFRLRDPTFGDVWVEVKPGPGSSEEDWARAKRFTHEGGGKMLLLAGVPIQRWHTLLLHGCDREAGDMGCAYTFASFEPGRLRGADCGFLEKHNPAYERAATAARSARFEHGEVGATL